MALTDNERERIREEEVTPIVGRQKLRRKQRSRLLTIAVLLDAGIDGVAADARVCPASIASWMERSRPRGEIAERVVDMSRRHRPQHDDQTLLLIRVMSWRASEILGNYAAL